MHLSAAIPLAPSKSHPGSYNVLLVKKGNDPSWTLPSVIETEEEGTEDSLEAASAALEQSVGLSIDRTLLPDQTFTVHTTQYFPVQVRAGTLNLEKDVRDFQWLDLSISVLKTHLTEQPDQLKVLGQIESNLNKTIHHRRKPSIKTDLATIEARKRTVEERQAALSPA